jgi:hypothetical protein
LKSNNQSIVDLARRTLIIINRRLKPELNNNTWLIASALNPLVDRLIGHTLEPTLAARRHQLLKEAMAVEAPDVIANDLPESITLRKRQRPANQNESIWLDVTKLFTPSDTVGIPMETKIDHEINYLRNWNTSVTLASFDVMQFWRENCELLPISSRVAMKILSIPATSLGCERLFSRAGHLQSKSRNRLLPLHLGQRIQLKINIEALRDLGVEDWWQPEMQSNRSVNSGSAPSTSQAPESTITQLE